jgi:hypothetical protein
MRDESELVGRNPLCGNAHLYIRCVSTLVAKGVDPMSPEIRIP